MQHLFTKIFCWSNKTVMYCNTIGQTKRTSRNDNFPGKTQPISQDLRLPKIHKPNLPLKPIGTDVESPARKNTLQALCNLEQSQ